MPTAEHQHSFELFGTRVSLLVYAAAAPLHTRLLIGRVEERLRAIHRALTRFDADSELSYLNAHAGEPLRVSPTLLSAIQAALRAAQLSGGLLDPTVLPDLERVGYRTSRVGVAPASILEALAKAPPRRPAIPRSQEDWKRIHVNEDQAIVRLPDELRIDLGGTAKGMAVDVAAEMLAGTLAFAVDAGGDIRVGGALARPRIVEIAHQFDDASNHRIELSAGAVATSGLRTRVWRTESAHAHHLIDPGRGLPAWTGVIQATALAPTALEGEALAKIALLRGPLAGRGVLERYGGALVLDGGKLVLVGDLAAPPIEDVLDPASA
jgi:FAD:protein FMN transferase